MKLKSYILFFLVIAINSSLFAQQGLQKRADSLFNKFAFVDAAKNYEKLINKGFNIDYATRQLADCYAFMRNPDNAAVYYKKVVQQENVPIEYFYKYAQTLRGKKDYKASRIWLKRFKDAGGKIERNKLSRDPDFITAVFNAKNTYFLEEININSEFSDFGAFEHDGKIYFASTANKGALRKLTYSWNKQPFLDIYAVEKNADTLIYHKSKLPGDVNSRFHDGPAVITKDGKTMYFSRNNFNRFALKKDKDGISNLAIFKASFVDGEWTNLEALPFNDKEYSFGHPALSPDETKLYFASDMPDGFGGSDIYYVEINTDGSYGNPQNAGAIINTKHNEVFPFVNSENILFFSSDGHLGLGLLDVFATVYNENNTIESVVNLGVPVNSNKDDFSFFMNKDGITGYISSNRDGGKGDDDIYAYNRIPRLKLEGIVKDSISGNPVSDALVKLSDNEDVQIVYMETDEDGKYEINIDRDNDYIVKANKDGYTEKIISVITQGLPNDAKSVIANFNLSPILPKTSNQAEEVITPKATTSSITIGEELGTIYFNFDSSKLRNEDIVQLSKIVDILNSNPKVTIKIESHTDSRGPSIYNDWLSQKRADVIYKQLLSQGINTDRITSHIGYGEQKLVNECDDNVRCSEADHQLNRRTNVIVVKAN